MIFCAAQNKRAIRSFFFLLFHISYQQNIIKSNDHYAAHSGIKEAQIQVD